MIKAEIVVDFPKWKTKIKNPNLYFKKKIKKLSSVRSLKKSNFQFKNWSGTINEHFFKTFISFKHRYYIRI